MIPKEFFPNPEGTIGFTSHRTSLAMEKYLNNKFKELDIDITMNQWGILYYLFKNDFISIENFPKKFLLSDEKIQEIIKKLENKEFISYSENKDSLFITEKGEQYVFNIMPVLGETLVFFRGDISPQEMLITINVLNKIYHNIYPDEELYILKAPPIFEREN